MKYNELKSDNYIKDWLSGIGAKQSTREIYTNSMRVYTEFLNKTPEQIILESEDDIRSGKLMRERKITKDLREFREYLENSGIAPMSIKGRLTGVRSFYNYYEITLPILPRSATKARPLMKNKEIPTKEDIREVIEICDPLEKAIILTGASSGLSVNEISSLKVKDFIDGYDKETEITTLHLMREKVGYEFYTFLTPEASRAILEYLEYRNRKSDKSDIRRIKQLQKQKIEYDKKGKPIGYLFICRSVSPEYLEVRKTNIKYAEELRKLESKSIQKIYRELSEKSRKSSPYGEWNLVRSHNIRKFFNSTLLNNHAEIFFTDFLMGHQIDATKEAYFRADPNSLKEEYKKYIPYLTIQKELNIDDSPEFKRLKDENEVLARETAKATVERVEIQNLRSELEELKKKKEEASEINKEFLLTSLKDPAIQELLKNLSK